MRRASPAGTSPPPGRATTPTRSARFLHELSDMVGRSNGGRPTSANGPNGPRPGPSWPSSSTSTGWSSCWARRPHGCSTRPGRPAPTSAPRPRSRPPAWSARPRPRPAASIDEADRDAAARRIEILAEADELRREAEAEVERRRAEGQTVVDVMRREAESERERMLADGERARAEAEAAAEQIRAVGPRAGPPPGRRGPGGARAHAGRPGPPAADRPRAARAAERRPRAPARRLRGGQAHGRRGHHRADRGAARGQGGQRGGHAPGQRRARGDGRGPRGRAVGGPHGGPGRRRRRGRRGVRRRARRDAAGSWPRRRRRTARPRPARSASTPSRRAPRAARARGPEAAPAPERAPGASPGAVASGRTGRCRRAAEPRPGAEPGPPPRRRARPVGSDPTPSRRRRARRAERWSEPVRGPGPPPPTSRGWPRPCRGRRARRGRGRPYVDELFARIRPSGPAGGAAAEADGGGRRRRRRRRGGRGRRRARRRRPTRHDVEPTPSRSHSAERGRGRWPRSSASWAAGSSGCWPTSRTRCSTCCGGAAGRRSPTSCPAGDEHADRFAIAADRRPRRGRRPRRRERRRRARPTSCDDLAGELGRTLVDPLRRADRAVVRRLRRRPRGGDRAAAGALPRVEGPAHRAAVRHYTAAAYAWGAYERGPGRAPSCAGWSTGPARPAPTPTTTRSPAPVGQGRRRSPPATAARPPTRAAGAWSCRRTSLADRAADPRPRPAAAGSAGGRSADAVGHGAGR